MRKSSTASLLSATASTQRTILFSPNLAHGNCDKLHVPVGTAEALIADGIPVQVLDVPGQIEATPALPTLLDNSIEL